MRADGGVGRCVVGTDLFTPPELFGANFAEIDRTLDHDRFGLAVLVFQLLFMGRHPFAGVFAGSGDMTIDRAIRENRFAYGRDASKRDTKPPPGALALSAVPPGLATLFERAFSLPGTGRPTAKEWHITLKAFRDALRRCSTRPGHLTPPHRRGCVWCELEVAGVRPMFLDPPGQPVAAATPAFDLSHVWGRIEKAAARKPHGVRVPNVQPQSPMPTPWPATLPNGPAPRPAMPAILINRPAPRTPALPPPEHHYVRVPRPPGQYRLAVALCVSNIACCAGAFVIGPVPVFAATALLFAILFTTLWLDLEHYRRTREWAANAPHRAEVERREKLLADFTRESQRRIVEAVESARQSFAAENLEADRLDAAARSEAARRRGALEAAGRAVAVNAAEWQTRADQLASMQSMRYQHVEGVRDRLRQLDLEQQDDIKKLASRSRQQQLDAYLGGFFIHHAQIEQLHRGRKDTLESYGIETAADVMQLTTTKVPGIGEVLTNRLLQWRIDLERRFQFDVKKDLSPHDRERMEQSHRARRLPLEAELTTGAMRLEELAAQAEREVAEFSRRHAERLSQRAQFQADVNAIPSGL